MNKEERFVNPYNFIPFERKCERSKPEINRNDCYTGYFDCKITLLTPLFIPNTSSDTRLVCESDRKEAAKRSEEDGKNVEEEFKGYDFFSYDDWSGEKAIDDLKEAYPPKEPIIPGSELRGTLRSVYEAAFNGCMSSVSSERILSRRSNDVMKPGILMEKNGQWFLQSCEKVMLFFPRKNMKQSKHKMGKKVSPEEYECWKEGQEIWFQLEDEEYTKIIKRKAIPIGKVIKDYKVIENSTYYVEPKDKEKAESMRMKYKKEGYEQGWLHKGESISAKHHESVFIHSDKASELKVADSDVRRLKGLVDEYKSSKNKENVRYRKYEVSPKGTLVYYNLKGGRVYLSPACIGMEVFTKTISDLLVNNGDYMPCTGSDDKLCPACQIFGMLDNTGEDASYAYGSKVRITDAKLIQPAVDRDKLFDAPLVLPELGEPKPSCVEFYTESPYELTEEKAHRDKSIENSEGYWTYDYKDVMKQDGKNKSKKIRIHTSLGDAQPKLRGRKFYWHSNPDCKSIREKTGEKLSAMKVRIRPMKKNNQPLFCFRVYFEQLNKQQLQQLKWTLDFEDRNCAHKIGRAKPLGFGSVKIQVDALVFREIDFKTGIWREKVQDIKTFFPNPIWNNKNRTYLKLIADWENKPDNVSYPCVKSAKNVNADEEDDAVGYEWFAQNKGKMRYPSFMKVLPKVNEDALKDLESSKALDMLDKK